MVDRAKMLYTFLDRSNPNRVFCGGNHICNLGDTFFRVNHGPPEAGRKFKVLTKDLIEW